MANQYEIFIPIDSSHADEILDGILYNMPYSPSPWGSIHGTEYDKKYKFISVVEPIYHKDSPTYKGGVKSDADIIGWKMIVEDK